jgi:hypothetical protein
LSCVARNAEGKRQENAIEPEKGAGQSRDPELNDQGLELRKRFMRTIKALERSSARPGSERTRRSARKGLNGWVC